MRNRRFWIPVALAAFAFGRPLLTSGADDTDGARVDFARDVLPVLSNKCFVCHGPDAKEEDFLRLDSAEGATADRGGYRAIDPDEPGNSAILKRIHSTDDPMPPEDAEKQLTDAERDVLTRWVHQGGEYAKHWAFVVPKRASPPGNKDASGSDAIDAFIADQLKPHGTGLAAEADRATLARRAALVLTGLPPEPKQLEAFLSDERWEAYDRFIDELLKSPRYGEHQARYWLDAVRYGDTHGLHLDNRRGIYPYRDWVVRAFNRNIPLDTFIKWQLAGDLMADPSLDELVATGYVRLNPTTGEGGAIPAEFQMKNNFDRVETLGTVFLGMSLTCARCHTHKYDPIPQTEYYRLLAFFNSTAESSMDGNKYEYGPTVRVPKDQTAWDHWSKLMQERDGLIRHAYTIIENREPVTGEALDKWLKGPKDARLTLLAEHTSFAPLKLADKAADLKKRIVEAQAGFTTSLVAKDLPSPRKTHVLRRGEYDLPIGDPVEPGIVSVMSSFPDNVPRNRLGLAEWLTSSDHPLVARVLINRVWQRVFGAGLVRTPEDFGLQGEQPTHPELLDWLAVELQDSKWDLKHMLKLMVTSRTFRQSSQWRKEIDDPENRLLSRGPSYRLDAEVLRDLGLWSSRLLDPTMGGEGVKPYQPAGMWLALAHPASNTKNYQRDKGQRLYRRSLYVYWKRTSPHPMMTLFDAPDRESSCVRRSRTSTAQQSLGLLNEIQRIEMSRKLAERLMKSAETDNARLDELYKLLACRPPLDHERDACTTLLKFMRDRYHGSEEDALALLSVGEIKRDESIQPAELAAWTQVAVIVLASDAAILLY